MCERMNQQPAGNQLVKRTGVSQKINEGTEVGYPQRPFGITNTDGHLDYRNIRPSRSYQDFDLKLEPPGFHVKVHGLRQRIDPEPALGIGHLGTSGNPYPEIGEFSSKTAGPWNIPAYHSLPHPHHEGS